MGTIDRRSIVMHISETGWLFIPENVFFLLPAALGFSLLLMISVPGLANFPFGMVIGGYALFVLSQQAAPTYPAPCLTGTRQPSCP